MASAGGSCALTSLLPPRCCNVVDKTKRSAAGSAGGSCALTSLPPPCCCNVVGFGVLAVDWAYPPCPSVGWMEGQQNQSVLRIVKPLSFLLSRSGWPPFAYDEGAALLTASPANGIGTKVYCPIEVYDDGWTSSAGGSCAVLWTS